MSQEHLSRRLGYTSNVLYLWERSRRLPSVGTFFRMAELRRFPLRECLARFASPAAQPSGLFRAGAPLSVPLLLQRLLGNRTSVELARLTGFDRTTLARWLAGKTEPRLSAFLELIDKCTLRLLDFVALFADP